MRLKQMFLAAVVALTLAAGASAQSFQTYWGYYPMAGWWGYLGYYCWWNEAVYADGHGYYYDSCGGSVAWF
jgi:hypothetical protein